MRFDFFYMVSSSCEKELLEIWNAVKEAALTYADSSTIAGYFDDNITTEQLEELLSCVRFNLEEGGTYENAELIKLEPYGSICSSYYDIFSVTIRAEYRSQAVSHPEGNYFTLLYLKYSNSGWQIYKLTPLDYVFFTIEPAEPT